MYNAHLHVLYVARDVQVPPQRPTDDVTTNVSSLERSDLEDRLEKFVARWLPQHAKLIYKVRFGQPYKEIIKYANQEEVNLIVIATHGRTGLNHLMMGSVAEKVMRLSRIPVLSVKPPKSLSILNTDYQGESLIPEMKAHELHRGT